MNLYDCNELKKRMVECTDFSAFQDYFFTNFVEKGRFMDLGRALARERVEPLAASFGEAYGRAHNIPIKALVITSQLVEVPEYGLIHGVLTLNGKHGSVLYFDDLAMGMLTVIENTKTGETKYIRFSTARHTSAKPS